jgi:hypothetical protein
MGKSEKAGGARVEFHATRSIRKYIYKWYNYVSNGSTLDVIASYFVADQLSYFQCRRRMLAKNAEMTARRKQ